MRPSLRTDPNLRRLRYAGGAGLFGRTACWLGRDHLLIVEIGLILERYRRFEFRDIHALVLQPTRTAFWANVFLWPVALVMLSASTWFYLQGTRAGWADPDLTAGFGVTIVPGLALLAAALLNTFAGPTCTLHIATGVQMQRLRSLTRRRRTEQFLNELTPLIRGAQASLGPQTGSPSEPSAADTTETPPSEPATQPPVERPPDDAPPVS